MGDKEACIQEGHWGSPGAGRRAGLPGSRSLAPGVHTGPPRPAPALGDSQAPLPRGRDHLFASGGPLDLEEMGWASPVHATLPQNVTVSGPLGRKSRYHEVTGVALIPWDQTPYRKRDTRKQICTDG